MFKNSYYLFVLGVGAFFTENNAMVPQGEYLKVLPQLIPDLYQQLGLYNAANLALGIINKAEGALAVYNTVKELKKLQEENRLPKNNKQFNLFLAKALYKKFPLYTEGKGSGRKRTYSTAVGSMLQMAEMLQDTDLVKEIKQKEPLADELIKAAATGNLDKVKKLVEEQGADVNALFASENVLARNPLFAAVKKKHLDIVKYLLSKHADPNNYGIGTISMSLTAQTPLMVAAESFPEAALLLLEHGADTTLRDSYGRSTLQYAEKGKNPDIISRIKTDSELREQKHTAPTIKQ